jgi:lambda repressor-like predicted transcriptional regulator
MLRDKGTSMREIITKTGLARTTLYRHLPPRPDKRGDGKGLEESATSVRS